jgi:hypothetical protein
MTNRRTFLTRLAALAAAPFVMLESGVRKVCGKPKVKPPVIVASAFGNSFSNNTIICEDGSIWSGDPGMKLPHGYTMTQVVCYMPPRVKK